MQYEEFLRTQKPGIIKFSGTKLRVPAVDDKGNTGNVTTTVADDVESGDPDDVLNVIAKQPNVKSAEAFKHEDGRTVSKSKEVQGLFQAAALGHEGAAKQVESLIAKRNAARLAQNAPTATPAK